MIRPYITWMRTRKRVACIAARAIHFAFPGWGCGNDVFKDLDHRDSAMYIEQVRSCARSKHARLSHACRA